MKSSDLVPSVLWIILAGLVAFQSIRFNVGRVDNPGPGFLPFCSSVVLGVLAFVLLVSQVYKKKEQRTMGGFKLGQLWMKAVFFLIGSFIYIIIIWEKIGYLIGTPFFLFFLLKFVGSQSFKRSTIISVISTIVSYLVFETWLCCMLPKGLLKGFNF
jgi:ABC-type xylose transport system permease subunit